VCINQSFSSQFTLHLINRELKQFLAQLRQDNEELRHRLRHAESRASRDQKGHVATHGSSPVRGAVNVAMSAANAKLQRRVEQQEVELQRLSNTHETLKMGYAREVARWKMKLGMIGGTGGGSEQLAAFQRASEENEVTINELKRLLLLSERECRSLRLVKGVPVTTNREALRSGYSAVGRSRSVTPSRDNRANTHRNASPSLTRRASSPSSNSQSRVGPPSNDRDNYYRRLSGAAKHSTPPGRYSSPRHNPHAQQQQQQQSRHASPSNFSRRMDSSPSTYSGRSPSPSSSLFGRFDPTEYQRAKEQRERDALSHKAWGAGGRPGPQLSAATRHDRESGYDSSHSHSSQRSRGSPRDHDENRRPYSGNGYHSDSSNASSRASQHSSGSRKSSRRKKAVGKLKQPPPVATTAWDHREAGIATRR
jgi:hypothetical protein